MLILFISI